MTDGVFRVSAKALITDEAGKLLLLQETNGEWDLPGGGIDVGEDPIQTVLREVQEECGLQATMIDEMPSMIWSAPWKPDMAFLYLGYRATTGDTGRFTPTDEAIALQYVSLDEASSLPARPGLQSYLRTRGLAKP